MEDAGKVDAPTLTEVWSAQLGYWIQRDVVEAIVAVNEQASEEAKAAGLDRWVGTMAVKDLISIRLSKFVPKSGDLVAVAKPGDYNPPFRPERAKRCSPERSRRTTTRWCSSR